MPDFVVQDQRNNRLHFVEVKYRKSGSFSIDDVKGAYLKIVSGIQFSFMFFLTTTCRTTMTFWKKAGS